MFKFSTAEDPRQRLFDNAWNGFVEQNWAYSMKQKSGSGCAYRGKDGTKCAIGWSLPDDMYKKSFEALGTEALTKILILSGFPEWASFYEFARALQDVHDFAANGAPPLSSELFEEKMRQFAAEHKLSVPAMADV